MWKRLQKYGRLMRAPIPRRLWLAFVIPAVLVAVGTAGYPLIEGPPWTWFDGLYMTVITITTIGYAETHPLTDGGRVFTMFLACSGIFTLAFLGSELVRSMVSGELQQAIGRQVVDDKLAAVSGHLIVCGYGRMGRIVCSELDRQRRAFVLIDQNPDRLRDLPFAHGIPLTGDATADEVLRKAGIDRARGLITVVASDADNLYITLSARLLNPKLLIVARAEEEDAEIKLRKVGANKVISPYLAGGHRAVQAVLRPAVLHFMEMATRPEFLDLQIEEVRVAPGSRLAGQSLRQARLQADLGVMVVGILRPDGDLLYNPPGDTVMEADATLIALGQRRQLELLEQLAAAEK
jgi:voltage-gated potassium channel